ncbi:MAG TPA: VOC family protein [Myxococcales bacterium]|nr:VOC family protein [Myxococcales bacterium]
MIDHMTLRVRDHAKSKAFYKAALAPLGYEIIMEWEGFCGMGVKKKPDFWLAPVDKEHAHYDQLHIAFRAPDRKAVKEFYEAAIKSGGKDNGGPGTRKEYHPNYYGAFVIDPDGHNVEACCHDPE